jgi:hypothetical protein
MYKAAKARARRMGLEYSITEKDILRKMELLNNTCPVLGIVFGSHETSCSLDRFYPDKGYTNENCYIISNLANIIKTNATTEQVGMVYRWMQEKEIELGRKDERSAEFYSLAGRRVRSLEN